MAKKGIWTLITAFASLAFDTGTRDDDSVDRLNHVVMYGLLLSLAFATGSKQFVGAPINCWIPAQYTEKFQKSYANHHCWVNSLYHVPFEDSISFPEEKRYYNDVGFYRWMTLILLALACLFRVPQVLWKELKYFSGVNVEKLVGMTTETALMDQETRDKQLSHVAEFFHRWVSTRATSARFRHLDFIQKMAGNTIFCYGKRSGHNLVLIYLTTKFLYLLNVVAQFFIISAFLKSNYWEFGLEVVKTYIQHGEWENDEIFPRIALCDMKIRQMQNLQTLTFQCVLTANLFLEKMFLIIWFCLLFLLIANAISFLRWTFQLLSETQTKQFLMSFSRHIMSGSLTTLQDKNMFRAMVDNYMKPDGVFILRIISVNTSDLLTIDLIRQIWLRYKKDHSVYALKNGSFHTTLNGIGDKSIGRG